MNNIRLYTRDLSVKDRSSSMTALDRIQSDKCEENFNRLRSLLVNPAQLNLIVPIVAPFYNLQNILLLMHQEGLL